jgi:uncharacterized HAD superfamily protein
VKIGFDLDGVLYPWHKYFFEEVQHKYDAYKDYTYLEFWEDIDNILEFDSSVWDLVDIPDLYNKENLIFEIKLRLEAIRKHSQLFYITWRPKPVYDMTKKWMDDCFIPDKENLYFANGKETKYDIVKKLSLDYYLEDKLEYYNNLKDITTCLLIKQPWNNYGKGINNCFDTTEDAIDFIIDSIVKKFKVEANEVSR